MLMRALELDVLPGSFCICRLADDAPDPAPRGPVWSVVRCDGERTLVAEERDVPADARTDAGWRCLRVRGPLDLALTGVLAGLSAPLAEAGVPLFAVSTFATDLLLVRDADLDAACHALASRGHTVARTDPAPRG